MRGALRRGLHPTHRPHTNEVTHMLRPHPRQPAARGRRLAVRSAVVVTSIALVAACGSSSKKASTGATGATATTNSASQADTTAILKYGTNFIGSAAQNFDPVTSHGAG